MKDLDACKAACAKKPSCKAIDFYRKTRWCNFFDRACTTPTASHDGASAYRLTDPVPGVSPDAYGGGWTFVNEAGRSPSDIDDLATITPGGYELPEYYIAEPFQEVLVQRVSATWYFTCKYM